MPPTKKVAKKKSGTRKPKQSSSTETEEAPVQIDLSPDDLRKTPLQAASIRVYYRLIVVSEDEDLVDRGNTVDLQGALRPSMLSYTPTELQQLLESGMLRPAIIQLTEELEKLKVPLKQIEHTTDDEVLDIPDDPPIPEPEKDTD
jgi:hypothetical protein